MSSTNHRSPSSLVCLLVALLCTAPLAAQDSRYGTWGSDGTRSLVEELRVLVDDAERARAADPRFLRDLRALAGRYDQPTQVELLRDSFADGEFYRSPAWVVTSGSFRVEPGWGLLSDVQSTQPAAPASSSSGSNKDLAAALITGLLSQYSQQGQQTQTQTQPTSAGAAARIETSVRISNAFAFEAVLSSEAGSQRIEFALYQGNGGGPSYVLAYSPHDATPVVLSRSGSRGTSVIDSYRRPLTAADLGRQQLAWTRAANGDMVVSIDGQELIRTRDDALKDPFDGLSISNHGGRFLVREVAVSGQR